MRDDLRTTDTRNVIEIRGLCKSFGDGDKRHAVVRDLDLTIRRGECFALLGPNGAGKTTTLRLCLGLTAPDSGSIVLGGLPVPSQGREARIRVGVVPQMDNLDPDFTARENLLVYGRYFGLSDAVILARIPALLEFASLTSKGDAKIGELSGGMKRRLTLARSLVNDPEVIFMDEPTTGLDPQARHLIWDRLKSLRADGKTILLTTHFMDEAERLADRLAVVDVGTKIAEGTPRALISEHIEASVVEVYGDGAREWADTRSTALSTRVEISGETVFCYTDAPEVLLDELVHVADVRYLHRPANLEDVFLKLTGREMRD